LVGFEYFQGLQDESSIEQLFLFVEPSDSHQTVITEQEISIISDFHLANQVRLAQNNFSTDVKELIAMAYPPCSSRFLLCGLLTTTSNHLL